MLNHRAQRRIDRFLAMMVVQIGMAPTRRARQASSRPLAALLYGLQIPWMFCVLALCGPFAVLGLILLLIAGQEEQ